MKKFIYPILIILIALVSVGMSEMLLIRWLDVAPLDVTANIFLYGILPTQLILVAITTGLLFKVYKFKPYVYMPLYFAVYLCAHAFELNMFLNPLRDIALYAAAILIACTFWFYLASRIYSR